MPIWKYEAERLGVMSQLEVASFYTSIAPERVCRFCHTALEELRNFFAKDFDIHDAYRRSLEINENKTYEHCHQTPPRFHRDARSEQSVDLETNMRHELFEERLRVCPLCGWWIAFRETVSCGPIVEVNTFGGVGGLKILDMSDVNAPLSEVRQYLTARFETRFTISPRLFEQTVASVFSDLGYSTRVTAYSGDDGIDVILDGKNGDMIGVQVKRYRDRIAVAQIRELIGALVINRLTKGFFVTTSDFQSGAQRTANLALQQGVRVELVNASEFYEALKIAQRKRYTSDDQEEFLRSFRWAHLGTRRADSQFTSGLNG